MPNTEAKKNAHFHFNHTQAGLVRIWCSGNVVKTLRGKAAAHFLDRIEAADMEGRQRIMAKTTGQFKFGNERLAREKTRRR